ncbi:MAG TPA: prolyl oligopeptidase family serine peptidase [Vicinamibacteria bacterium]
MVWTVVVALESGAADETPLTAKSLAERVQIQAEPSYAFRFNQGAGPYGAPTKPLLERRRAYFPGEKVRLSFKLPPDAKIAASIESRVALFLTDLDGRPVQSVEPVPVKATSSGVEGAIEWTVGPVKEGQYFLAARFTDAAGKTLTTRSEIVTIAPEYPGLLAAAEAALAKAAAKKATLGPLVREVSLPSVEMRVEEAKMRFYDFGRAPRDLDFLKVNLEAARAEAEQIMAGEDPYKDRAGVFTKAYRSPVDDTLQPYALYVPKAYDPAKAYPLLVTLHGATSNHLLNRRRVFGLGNRPGESDYEAIRNDVAYPEIDFIVAAPYGRGEVAGYSGIAEGDVLRVMDDVARAYNVDPDRVHLTGLSMGGGGTWQIGLRYPDRFASISPVCAVANLTMFPWAAGMRPLDKELAELTSAMAVAENASNQQVLIFHGDEDGAVPVEQSRKMVEIYKSLGWLDKNVRYFELPGVHHFAWDFSYRDASLFDRIRDLRRQRFPEHVVYKTHTVRYNKAYWLRIDRMDRGMKLARIEGRRNASAFDVTTDNLSAFSILLDPEIAPLGKPVEVIVNGKPAYKGPATGKALSFAADKKGAFAQKPWPGPPVGPPDHQEAGFRGGSLAQYGAHLYVYGTKGEAAANEASKKAAEALADWGPNVRARFKVVADKDVTSDLMLANNLLLFGSAKVNQIVAGIESQLPLRQDDDGTKAGGKRVAGPRASYRIDHPNPVAPGRLVRVFGASSTPGFERLVSMAPGQGPSAYADYTVVAEDGKVALEGFFRDDYKIAAP